MFFIGASLSIDVLKAVGIKPLVQGILLWVIISLSTLAYIYFVQEEKRENYIKEKKVGE